MKFKMTKLKKRLTAMLMCAAIGVMSCLPVSAATTTCTHDLEFKGIVTTQDVEEVTDCFRCGVCVQCLDQKITTIYWRHYYCSECRENTMLMDHEEQEIYCLCTNCSCCDY